MAHLGDVLLAGQARYHWLAPSLGGQHFTGLDEIKEPFPFRVVRLPPQGFDSLFLFGRLVHSLI